MRIFEKIKSVLTIIVSAIFIGTIAYAWIKVALDPSHKESTRRLNEKEYHRHFNGYVMRVYIDSANHSIPKISIKTKDELMEFAPQYFSVLNRDIKVGDSLIKIKNSYVYELKRGNKVISRIVGEPKE